ncbi:MAG: type I secretion system permease/ATPase [Alphaproteobacteria bacterium]
MSSVRLGRPELVKARRTGRSFLFCVFLFSIFVNLLMLTGPLFMLQVYDRVLSSRSEATLVALFILVGALYALMTMLDYARGRVLARFGARFQEALEERVFTAVLRRAVIPSERAAPATSLRDLETIQSTLASPGFLALFDLPWAPIFFVAIFVFHPLLGWLGLAGGGVLISLTLLNQVLTKSKVLESQSSAAKGQNLVDQARKSGEVIRTLGMSKVITQRWAAASKQTQDQTIRSSDVSGLFTAITKSFRMFLQSAMLALGAYLALRGEVTPGAMIAGSIILGRALAPIEQSLGQWPQLQRSRAGWTALIELLSTTPVEETHIGLPRPKAHLTVRNVNVLPPGAQRPTLINISFDIKPGEAVGVIGPSGTGKSSLARALVGIWPPSSGEIRLGGAKLTQYDSDVLGSYLGYLPQDVSLLDGTVAENIARMSTEPDEAEVVRAAKAAHAHDLVLSLPDGYNTVVEGGNIQLSGGQKQRLALARALYGDPELMIFDEPNSALDAEGSKALNFAVHEMKAKGKAIVIMTHRPGAISQCDQLIVLEGGKIMIKGPRDEVIRAMTSNAQAVQKSVDAGAKLNGT